MSSKKDFENSTDSNKDLFKNVPNEISLKNLYLKKKKESNTTNYNLTDQEIKIVNINDDIKARLISNDNGYFVDLRKYYKGYPTKKGIRIAAKKFIDAAELLKEDVEYIFKK